jgi:hypothetical protein
LPGSWENTGKWAWEKKEWYVGVSATYLACPEFTSPWSDHFAYVGPKAFRPCLLRAPAPPLAQEIENPQG